jgi:hypothetical protein
MTVFKKRSARNTIEHLSNTDCFKKNLCHCDNPGGLCKCPATGRAPGRDPGPASLLYDPFCLHFKLGPAGAGCQWRAALGSWAGGPNGLICNAALEIRPGVSLSQVRSGHYSAKVQDHESQHHPAA